MTFSFFFSQKFLQFNYMMDGWVCSRTKIHTIKEDVLIKQINISN